jgi:hypothetical protein
MAVKGSRTEILAPTIFLSRYYSSVVPSSFRLNSTMPPPVEQGGRALTISHTNFAVSGCLHRTRDLDTASVPRALVKWRRNRNTLECACMTLSRDYSFRMQLIEIVDDFESTDRIVGYFDVHLQSS